MTFTALPINASGGSPAYSSANLRDALSVLAAPAGSARPLGAISGVRVGSNAFAVSVASWPTISIGPGSGLLDIESPVATGPYFVSSDATDTSLTGTVAGGSDRQDGVYLKLSDTDVDSSGLRRVEPVYIQGSASPPATPARHFRLAVITVPHSGGGSPSVAMDKIYTVAAGGVLPVSGSSQYPASPYEGFIVDDASDDAVNRFDGTNWRPVNNDVVLVGSGGPLAGTLNPAKRIRTAVVHGNTISDAANGLINVDLSSLGAACLISALTVTALGTTGTADRLLIRLDGTTLTNLQLQTRSATTGLGIPSTRMEFIIHVLYHK